MPRVVACSECRIIEKLPDVHPKTPMVQAVLEWESGERHVMRDENGLPKMVPAFDPVLEHWVEQHSHGFDDAYVMGGIITLWGVDQKTWDNLDPITEVKKTLLESTGHIYEEAESIREDAILCYNAHGNPDLQSGCSDYLHESKRIGPSSYKVEGQTIDIPLKFRQYLCYACPYQSGVIAVEMRRKAGMYDD